MVLLLILHACVKNAWISFFFSTWTHVSSVCDDVSIIDYFLCLQRSQGIQMILFKGKVMMDSFKRYGHKQMLHDYYSLLIFWNYWIPTILLICNVFFYVFPPFQDWWNDLLLENNYKEVDYSGKMVLLLDILVMSSDVGDKTLVFTQSIPTLDLIELYLSRLPRLGKKGKFWRKGKDWYRCAYIAVNCFHSWVFCLFMI